MRNDTHAALAAALLVATPATAQDMHGHHAMHDDEPQMSMPAAGHHDADAADTPNAVKGSGTSRLPAAEGAMQGLHLRTGDWMLMAHGNVWGVYTDQSGPRGDAMGFVESMAMLSAERGFANGARLELRTMLSLEPLMGQRGYPNLLATGETAHGEPLVDRQHPHDLFMELAARVDVPLGEGVTGFLYGGPVGEPAPAARADQPSLVRFDAHHLWRRDRRAGHRALAARSVGVSRARARRGALGHRNAQAR